MVDPAGTLGPGGAPPGGPRRAVEEPGRGAGMPRRAVERRMSLQPRNLEVICQKHLKTDEFDPFSQPAGMVRKYAGTTSYDR